MFHYHFGSKEQFVRRLLQQLYDEMFANLELAASARLPGDALRAALNVLGRFVRDNAKSPAALADPDGFDRGVQRQQSGLLFHAPRQSSLTSPPLEHVLFERGGRLSHRQYRRRI